MLDQRGGAEDVVRVLDAVEFVEGRRFKIHLQCVADVLLCSVSAISI